MEKSKNRFTEILKQIFYSLGIIAIIVFLNTEFRPDKIQKSNNLNTPQVQVIEKEVIVKEYMSGTTLGLIVVSFFFLIFCIGFFYSMIKTTELHIKKKALDSSPKQ